MVEIVSQGCYGIMNLMGSPRDDLVVKKSKEIWSWNFRNDTHCMKSIKVLRGLISAMHWRFKTVDPTLIHHFSFAFGPLAALQTLLVRFAVALSAIGPPAAPALRKLSYCTEWEVMVLNDSLFVSTIPPLFSLALACDSPYLSPFP